MYLYGASGHAKVIAEVLSSCGIEVSGWVDDDTSKRMFLGKRVVHSADGLSPMIISVGDNAMRARIAARLHCAFGTAIHRQAVVSPTAMVGEGTVVMASATINAEAMIGRHCIVNTGAVVEHECRIGDFVHVSPNATLCGGVSVGEGTWICAGAIVAQGVSIGRWCVVGAGAVVLGDVGDGQTAVGAPARCVKRNTLNYSKLGGVSKKPLKPYNSNCFGYAA